MEFKYVFITDGGWDRLNFSEIEDETRLYYVGITRVKKGLFLYSLKGQKNPHTKKFHKFPYIYEKMAKNSKIKGYKSGVKVSIIGMKDLFISYGGYFHKNHEIHSNLKNLNPKDRVYLEFENLKYGKVIVLKDKNQNKIGRLSNHGINRWKSVLEKEAKPVGRVLAIIQRQKEDDEDIERRKNIKANQWELPIIEVLHE
ncbi:MAG: hypothetical protein RBR53_05610 [Desulforegulaceae bacterium]|nr:hypothetical protein [Desulforegulaceae bacterium]